MWDESGKPETEAFALLNQALDWCAEFRFSAIVDVHILRSHHFNEMERPLWTKPEAQERFFQCWRELSDALHSRPVDMVADELMNESVADNPEDWNNLGAKASRRHPGQGAQTGDCDRVQQMAVGGYVRPIEGKRGKNKQGRANLRQVSYALFCSTDGQLPLFYEVYEGNRNDAKEFPKVLEKFGQWLKECARCSLRGS